MNCVILQKIVYHLPKTKRPVYAVVLGQSESVSLLFVKPNGASHMLAFAVQNERGIYEDVGASQFSVDSTSLAAIGMKMQAIAGNLHEAEVEKFLEDLL